MKKKKNKTFGELFKYLAVERYLIPLGLYRLAGAVDNHHPYIYTNPPAQVHFLFYSFIYLKFIYSYIYIYILRLNLLIVIKFLC